MLYGYETEVELIQRSAGDFNCLLSGYLFQIQPLLQPRLYLAQPAMSLYGGIKFTDAAKAIAGDAPSPLVAKEEASAGPPGSKQVASETDSAGPSTGPPSIPHPKPVVQSDVLKFAPRINKAKPMNKPVGTSIPVYSAPPSISSPGPSSSRPESVPSKGAEEEQVVLGPDGRPLAKAPAMTLKPNDRKRKKKKVGTSTACSQTLLKSRRGEDQCFPLSTPRSSMTPVAQMILESISIIAKRSRRREYSATSRKSGEKLRVWTVGKAVITQAVKTKRREETVCRYGLLHPLD